MARDRDTHPGATNVPLRILIDANLYLRFYDARQAEYKKLLRTLVEIQDSIFITQQIVSEVQRNKLAVFQKSCAPSIDTPQDSETPRALRYGSSREVGDLE